MKSDNNIIDLNKAEQKRKAKKRMSFFRRDDGDKKHVITYARRGTERVSISIN